MAVLVFDKRPLWWSKKSVLPCNLAYHPGPVLPPDADVSPQKGFQTRTAGSKKTNRFHLVHHCFSFQGEESNSSANKCLLKVALFSAQLENYDRAIQIYEQVNPIFLKKKSVWPGWAKFCHLGYFLWLVAIFSSKKGRRSHLRLSTQKSSPRKWLLFGLLFQITRILQF